MKEDIIEIQNEINELKEQSFAMELLQDMRKTNKRMFVLLITVLIMWFATIGAFIYYINTVDYEEITETAEVENESGNANACVGSNCNNGVITNGEGESGKKN